MQTCEMHTTRRTSKYSVDKHLTAIVFQAVASRVAWLYGKVIRKAVAHVSAAAQVH